MTATTNAAAAAITPEAKAPAKKFKSIVVDTLTSIMKNQVQDHWMDGGMNHNKWRDFGLELNQFARALMDEFGFTLVGVCGREGTGKTYGMKFLEEGTNIWYNCDRKDITFKGGRQQYGTKIKPTPYQKQPKTYDEILENLRKIKKNNLFEEDVLAYLIMHVEEFKDPAGNVREKSKIMGNVSKNGLDDMMTMMYYTEIVPDGAGGVTYRMRTRNTGFNTGRTMEDQHAEEFIDNNFQTIMESFKSY